MGAGTYPPVAQWPDVVVVLGGGPAEEVGPPDPLQALAERSPATLVVAADSGLGRAAAAGLRVAHAVGDFDSVDPGQLDRAAANGTAVHRHHQDKDATDSELAFDLAATLSRPGGHIWVVGSISGRFDHVLADLLALTGPVFAQVDVTAHFDDTVVTVVRPGRPRSIHGEVGEQVSLIPVHGPTGGVATDGLRWALVDATLAAGTTRGVSNELAAATATVSVGDGVVAVLQPGTRAEVVPRSTPYDPTPR